MLKRPLHTLATIVALSVAPAGLYACDDGPSKNAAPVSSELAPAAKPTAAAKTYEVKSDTSKVTFTMEAPIEKIHGDAPKSLSGEFNVDPMDLTKSNGLVKIDLDTLVVSQQKRESKDGEFGEKQTVDKQNEHMKAWLEISPDTPEQDRAKNRYIEFKVTKVSVLEGKPNIMEMEGAERKVKLMLAGDFRLHQRAVPKQAEVELTFKMDGDKPQSVSVKSTKPIPVELEKHDVRPREAFGKLAQAGFEALSEKVNKTAEVSVEFEAAAK